MSSIVLDIAQLEVSLRSHRGRSKPVLDRVSLSIAQGETLCLVGESGSGKSVTALSIMGLLPAREMKITGGSIRLDGEELVGASKSVLRQLRTTRMAMIFQEPMTALNPLISVGRQVEEVLRAHTALDRKNRRRKVLDALEEVQLSDAERIYDAYPHQLSGGQRQRIMIAMALILRPKLLISDEPTSALDVVTQKQILRLLSDLREQYDTAVLFITHDMGVVSEVADRVAVMQRGRIIETASLDAILAHPKQDYTRDLLAAVPSLTPRPARSPSDAPIALATHALSVTYNRRPWFGKARVIEAGVDVNLELKAGRTLGIVGESGSGKSTLARCIVRLIPPNGGSITIGGKEIANIPERALKPHRRDFQIIFQDPYRSLNPRRQIGEAIGEGLLNFGMSHDDALQEARRLLRLVGLPGNALHNYPHQFSGGERQRIAVARALALKPLVLIADEPVSALDIRNQAKILKLLADVQEKTGVAILFITHDLRVAAQICDDIAIMQDGRIVEYGPAAELLSTPREAYTKQLCKAAPGRYWDFAQYRPAEAASSRST